MPVDRRRRGEPPGAASVRSRNASRAPACRAGRRGRSPDRSARRGACARLPARPRARDRAGCSRRRKPSPARPGAPAPVRTPACASIAARVLRRRRGRSARAGRGSLRWRLRHCAARRGPRCEPASGRRVRAHRASSRARRRASRRAAGRWATERSGRRSGVIGGHLRGAAAQVSASSPRGVRRRRGCHDARARRCAWPGSPADRATSAAPARAAACAPRRGARRPGCARRSRGGASAASRCTGLTTRRPAAMCSRTIGSGTKPQPMQRKSASIFSCMLLTVSTSWPGSRLTVAGVRRCAESATATARYRISSASSSGSLAAASG